MENTYYIKQYDERKQVSMTGARALVILIALIEGPKTFEQLRDFLFECRVVDKKYSIDTIRVDLNTLKLIGCDISKAVKATNRRFNLLSQPFSFIMTSKEVKAFKHIYSTMLDSLSPKQLLDYHDFFLQLSEKVKDEKIKEEILGISILKSVNIDLIRELVSDETKHNKIRIGYKPQRYRATEYDITVQALRLRNQQLYVYCYNHTMKQRSFLNLSRITGIICKMFDKDSPKGLDTFVRFKLKNYSKLSLEETETIVEVQEDDCIVEGRYFNEFIAIQRILEFGSSCVVLSPDGFKAKIIEKLKKMRAMYVSK